MGKFFNRLVSENLINDWASTLDWLFDDAKFSKTRNWNGGYTSSFTKRIKKLKYLSDNEKRVFYGKYNSNDFPNQNKSNHKKRLPYIMITTGESFARDLIRHIRNGIAHGETDISKVGDTLYIEIIDYFDKTKSADKQTAYLFIPLEYITQFGKIYEEMNKSIMNTTPKDRTNTKKYKNKEIK